MVSMQPLFSDNWAGLKIDHVFHNILIQVARTEAVFNWFIIVTRWGWNRIVKHILM